MKKYIATKCLLLGVVVASAMTACSSDKDEPLMPQDDRIPVVFSTTDMSVTTRANEDKMTSPQMVAQAGGFGVFAYYTNGNGSTDGAYNASSTPNFMYNQQVTGTDAVAPVWSYTPLKYWPNEIGATAKSSHVDKLTFFAYAPYIAATAVTTSNITGFSLNSDTGDPWLTYSSPKTTAGYDVVYAKVVDMAKPDIDDKVTLNFSHALASLSFEITNTSGLDLQKIEVYGWRTAGIRTAGKLNLNTGAWSEVTTVKDKTVVVFEKAADPLPLTGGNWKVIPDDNDQEFFVRIYFKEGTNMRWLPEIPFKEKFEAGKNKITQITIP